MTALAELSEDNLFTSARRVVRFVSVDDSGGGLLSLDTIKAVDHLRKMVDAEERRIKGAAQASDPEKSA